MGARGDHEGPYSRQAGGQSREGAVTADVEGTEDPGPLALRMANGPQAKGSCDPQKLEKAGK